MVNREKVIKGMEFCTQHGSMCGSDCNGHYERYTDDGYVIKLVDEYRSKCPYGKCETGCVVTLARDTLELLKEQETHVSIVDTKIIGFPQGDKEVFCCGDCKSVLNDSFSFCPFCGVKLDWSEQRGAVKWDG